jgi:hypothetical protein
MHYESCSIYLPFSSHLYLWTSLIINETHHGQTVTLSYGLYVENLEILARINLQHNVEKITGITQSQKLDDAGNKIFYSKVLRFNM